MKTLFKLIICFPDITSKKKWKGYPRLYGIIVSFCQRPLYGSFDKRFWNSEALVDTNFVTGSQIRTGPYSIKKTIPVSFVKIIVTRVSCNGLNIGELVLGNANKLLGKVTKRVLQEKKFRLAEALNHTIHTLIQSAMLSQISQFCWEVKNWLLLKIKVHKTKVRRAFSKMLSRAMQGLALFPFQYMFTYYYKWKILLIKGKINPKTCRYF